MNNYVRTIALLGAILGKVEHVTSGVTNNFRESNKMVEVDTRLKSVTEWLKSKETNKLKKYGYRKKYKNETHLLKHSSLKIKYKQYVT